MTPETASRPSLPQAELALLDELVERAVAGDAQALEVFFTVLQSRYGKLVHRRLRGHRGITRTATLEDVFQQGMLDLFERIRQEKPSDLRSPGRIDILSYFQKICDQKLENLKKPRKDPLLARRKEGLPSELIRDYRRTRPEDPLEKDPYQGRHQRMLDEELGNLSPRDRELLLQYFSRVPYSQISHQTGRSETALQSTVHRLKRRIAARLAERSDTAFFHQLGVDEPSSPSAEPTEDEIRAAVERLPVETKAALKAVHFEGLSLAALAARLGEKGLEKAQARLDRGYETLSLKLGIPFPGAFSRLKP